MLLAEETFIFSKRGKTRPAPTLTPAQDAAAKELLASFSSGHVFVLKADAGLGRTTVLKNLHATTGGALLGMRQFIDMLMVRRPDAVEQAFVELLEDALASHDIVFLDDLHLITRITSRYHYDKFALLDAALEAILSAAGATGKKLVFSNADAYVPAPVHARAYAAKIRDFTAADFEAIARAYLATGNADGLDYSLIHRTAPALNAHQIGRACIRFAKTTGLTTDIFIRYLTAHNLTSNVEAAEVQNIDWKDLRGMDDVIEALEAKIALPFENSALAAEFNLKPRRGVLLAGPPGTGKTTIGRALAHRLKGKFFLIDGTVIAGSCDFHDEVARIFDNAKRNAPAVIFIDDSDVIFEDNSKGFYRYLLTMMDGLESASAERVCVMMTAMDVGSLPPALLRSGRIELWLETRLPDEEARAAILGERLSKLPAPIGEANIAVLAAASRNLTGADLKAVVEDGKLSFAHERANARPARPVEDYFLEAIETVKENRRRYSRGRSAKDADGARFGFSPE